MELKDYYDTLGVKLDDGKNVIDHYGHSWEKAQKSVK